MFHLLPCLTTFNIVEYITERELNKSCGVLLICNSLHIDLHLTCSIVRLPLPCHALLNRTCIILVCASCHVHARAFTMLFVSFRCCFLVPVMLRFWGFVHLRLVHLCGFIFFMDFILLPSGILGKMTITLDVITIIAMLVASFYRYAALPTTCYQASQIAMNL